MTKRFRVLLPILVILGSVAVAAMIVRARPAVERIEARAQPPLVRVIQVTREAIPLNVTSSGVVKAASQSTLVAQVGARVASLSADFAEGSFFRKGQVLARLDPRDFELAVTQAEARVAQAEVQLEREQAEVEMAIEEWTELGSGEPATLVLREPQLAQARAEVKASRASLEQARLQLERSVIRAPYAGRVQRKLVDVGQYVNPGSPLAEVYSTDRAEIDLKVPQDELAFLQVSLGRPSGPQPAVRLNGRIGTTSVSWPARIVRTGSQIDPQTRMVSLIAEIDDPFSLADSHTAPLPMGLYLDAEIAGRTADDAIALPRAALRDDYRVLVVDPDNRLDIRDVEILRIGTREVVVTAGLESGEQVCISPLTAVIEGMRVRVQSTDEPVRTATPKGDLS
ncbi:MAG: efflux RND transporter periplasmic adaptor subunit [Thermoanaerobaculia bacterium]